MKKVQTVISGKTIDLEKAILETIILVCCGASLIAGGILLFGWSYIHADMLLALIR